MNYTEETFPHNNWYLHFTEEERPVVDNWRINIIKCSRLPCPGNYINYLGAVGWWKDRWAGRRRGITFSDFKKFILKEQEEVVVHQDYNYLIDIFKKYNIV